MIIQHPFTLEGLSINLLLTSPSLQFRTVYNVVSAFQLFGEYRVLHGGNNVHCGSNVTEIIEVSWVRKRGKSTRSAAEKTPRRPPNTRGSTIHLSHQAQS